MRREHSDVAVPTAHEHAAFNEGAPPHPNDTRVGATGIGILSGIPNSLPSTAGAVELTGTIGTIVSCVVATGEARRITTAGGATHTARRSQMDRRCDGHPSASTHAAGWR